MSEIIRTVGGRRGVNGRIEAHTATVSTDEDGAGQTTVTWDSAFADSDSVVVVATARSPDPVGVYVSASGASQASVNVANGPDEGDVEVGVIVAGQ